MSKITELAAQIWELWKKIKEEEIAFKERVNYLAKHNINETFLTGPKSSAYSQLKKICEDLLKELNK